MAQKASTHRFEPEVQAALNHLSKILQCPKNRLINEAVKLYVRQRSREAEQELETTLKTLRAYRLRDPDFEEAIETFVSAEAQSTGSDPVEGRPFYRESPVRTEIQSLLHA